MVLIQAKSASAALQGLAPRPSWPRSSRSCPGRQITARRAQQQRVRRLRVFSELAFIDGDDAVHSATAAAAEAQAEIDELVANGSVSGITSSESAALRGELKELKDRMDEIQAQLEQINDRARDRAVSLAQAVRAAGEGEAGPMEALQYQQDDQLHQDEKSWDTMMDTFTQLMSKGYIQSTEKIRDRLLLTEWELTRKTVAQRRGVSHFELHCASTHVDLPYEVVTQLYEDPANLDIITDPHLRMQARASIHQAVDEEFMKAYSHCTAEAQKLAQQFSQSDFISKLLPESGVLDALKKVVPLALKAVI